MEKIKLSKFVLKQTLNSALTMGLLNPNPDLI